MALLEGELSLKYFRGWEVVEDFDDSCGIRRGKRGVLVCNGEPGVKLKCILALTEVCSSYV